MRGGRRSLFRNPKVRLQPERLEARDLLAVDLLGKVLPPAYSSDPMGIQVAGQYAYFWVDAQRGTFESDHLLYRTDGTPQGTIPLGVEKTTNSYQGVALGDRFVMFADQDMYVTEGTPETTRHVAGLQVQMGFNKIDTFNERVYFTASDQDVIRSPWHSTADLMVSDGTIEGTGFLFPDDGVSDNITIQGVQDGKLLFQYEGGTVAGHEVWNTDGTSAGTQKLAIGNGGLNDVRVVAELGGQLVAERDQQLLFIDPQTFTFVPSTAGNLRFFDTIQESSQHMLFLRSERFTTEVWVTDGTVEGTKAILEQAANPSAPTLIGDRFIFSANGTVWTYDPVNDQLEAVRTFPVPRSSQPGNFSLAPDEFVQYGDKVIFMAAGEEVGAELWITDGNSDGTTVLADVWPGHFSSEPTELTVFGDQLLFAARHPEVGNELWSYNLETGDLQLLADILRSFESPAELRTELVAQANGLSFFIMDDGKTGAQLWRTNGTADGTMRLTNVEAFQQQLGAESNFTVWNDRVYFLASVPQYGLELWSTDGTPENTKMEVDLVAGPDSPFETIKPIFATSTGVVFQADGDLMIRWDGTEETPIVTDGMVAGTAVFTDAWQWQDETILIAGDEIYRFSNQFGAYQRVHFLTGVSEVPLLLPDASGAIVPTRLGLWHYDFASGTQRPLSEWRALAVDIVGDSVIAWQYDETFPADERYRLQRWQIGEWEVQEIAFAERFYAIVPSDDRAVSYQVINQGPTRPSFLVGITEASVLENSPEAVLTEVVETRWDNSADYSIHNNQLLYKDISPTSGRFTLLAMDLSAEPIDEPVVDIHVLDDLFFQVYQTPNPVSNPRLDLDRDGQVTEADVDFAFETVLNTVRADVNLDQRVDFTDFLAISLHFGDRGSSRSEGDITGDGAVDFLDFLALSSAFGFDGREN